MRGVAEPEMPAPVSDAVGRGRPARASWIAEMAGEGGGSKEDGDVEVSGRRRVLS